MTARARLGRILHHGFRAVLGAVLLPLLHVATACRVGTALRFGHRRTSSWFSASVPFGLFVFRDLFFFSASSAASCSSASSVRCDPIGTGRAPSHSRRADTRLRVRYEVKVTMWLERRTRREARHADRNVPADGIDRHRKDSFDRRAGGSDPGAQLSIDVRIRKCTSSGAGPGAATPKANATRCDRVGAASRAICRAPGVGVESTRFAVVD